MGVGASIAMEASSGDRNNVTLVERSGKREEKELCAMQVEDVARQCVSRRRDSRDEEMTPAVFVDLIKHGAQISRDVKESIRIYGRIERCVINQEGVKEVPLRLTYRPHRHAHIMDPPCSFVASSDALSRFVECPSLRSVLETISLDTDTIRRRLTDVKEKRLDHMIILFSPSDVPVALADLDGIHSLLVSVHPQAAERFQKVIPIFKSYYVGADNFQRRLEMFSSDDWATYKGLRDCMWLPNGIHLEHPVCGCQHYDFEKYCTEFDKLHNEEITPIRNSSEVPNLEAVLETRKMMNIMFDCNRFYGMDGYTYHAHGSRLDKEFMALNQPLDAVNAYGHKIFHCRFLSEVQRFAQTAE
jgi:hypothetical protein